MMLQASRKVQRKAIKDSSNKANRKQCTDTGIRIDIFVRVNEEDDEEEDTRKASGNEQESRREKKKKMTTR